MALDLWWEILLVAVASVVGCFCCCVVVLNLVHEDDENPARNDVENPARNDVENPARNDVENPARNDVENPARNDVEKPARNDVENPARNDVEKPARNVENPARNDVEKPARNDVAKPARNNVEKPTREDQDDSDVENQLVRVSTRQLAAYGFLPGDHIVREDFGYDHHAIFIAGSKNGKFKKAGYVIHHTKRAGIVREEVELDRYQLECRARNGKVVVARAVEMANAQETQPNWYDFFFNNCEVFCRNCIYGEWSSSKQFTQFAARSVDIVVRSTPILTATELGWQTGKNIEAWCRGELSGEEALTLVMQDATSVAAGLAGAGGGAWIGFWVGGPIGAVVGGIVGGYAGQLVGTRLFRWMRNLLVGSEGGSSPEVGLLKAYEFMGLNPSTATIREVNKRYRKMALQMHPDKGGDPEDWTMLQVCMEIIRAHLE